MSSLKRKKSGYVGDFGLADKMDKFLGLQNQRRCMVVIRNHFPVLTGLVYRFGPKKK